jgi:hypothetical protein
MELILCSSGSGSSSAPDSSSNYTTVSVVSSLGYDANGCTHISIPVAVSIQLGIVIAWTLVLVLLYYVTQCCRRHRRTHYGSSTERVRFRASSEIVPTKLQLQPQSRLLRSLTIARKQDDFTEVPL